MDYEKKYKALVEAVKTLKETNPSDEGIQNWVNDNVPELKESEDERISKEIRDFICWATDRGSITKEQMGKSNLWLAWLEKQGEQKPAEWSEEDEKELNGICMYIMCSDSPEGYTEWIDWLKSLKDRVQPQPKQEWSEEDESHIRYLIECLEYCKKGVALTMSTSTSQEYINWLKSLRPQTTWKPSDEQMKILNEVLNFAANHESPHWNEDIFGTLNNLIRQLKKLRKE